MRPSSGERQQLREPHVQHFILAGFGSLWHSLGAFCIAVQQYWPLLWSGLYGAGYMHQAAFPGLWQDCSSEGMWAKHQPDPSHPSFGFAPFFWCQEEIIQSKNAHQWAAYLREMFRANAGCWPRQHQPLYSSPRSHKAQHGKWSLLSLHSAEQISYSH